MKSAKAMAQAVKLSVEDRAEEIMPLIKAAADRGERKVVIDIRRKDKDLCKFLQTKGYKVKIEYWDLMKVTISISF